MVAYDGGVTARVGFVTAYNVVVVAFNRVNRRQTIVA